MRAPKIVLVIVLLAGAFPLLLGGFDPAGASTFTVTRKNDPAPNGCNNNGCSLREAVIAANNRPGPDTIRLPRGRFELTRPVPDEDASLSGDLDVLKNTTITGAGPGRTIVDGNRNDRIFHFGANVEAGMLSDLAVVGGLIEDDSALYGGGGLLNLGNLTLRNTLIENNRSATGDGGGIANEGRLVVSHSRVTGNSTLDECCGGGVSNTGRLRLSRSRIDHNHASCCGGGINSEVGRVTLVRAKLDHNEAGDERMSDTECCGGAFYANDGSLTATRSSFNFNESMNCCGGAIFTSDKLVLRSSVVKGNTARSDSGGGIFMTTGSMKLIDTRVLNNRLAGGGIRGGGIYADNSDVTLIRSLVRNNRAMGGVSGGGGILADTSSLVMRSSTIANNSTGGDGGGINLETTGVTQISNSTISGNSAEGTGGGIWEAIPDPFALLHVTITRNFSQGPGGGISTNGGFWSIARSIVAGNNTDCNSVLTGPAGPNLDEGGSCFSGPEAIHSDPKLDPLAHNGGRTPTHLPRKASPAVDAVSGSSCPPPGRDQRGVKRPQNGDGEAGKRCDLGAVERKPNE